MAQNVTRSVPMEMLWFLRQAKAFRVLVSTLQRQAQEGGRGSHSYCCEKFNNVSRARAAPIQRYGSLAANWLAVWSVIMVTQNPPHLQVILLNLE